MSPQRLHVKAMESGAVFITTGQRQSCAGPTCQYIL